MIDYDVIVVGAGPSGATAAVAARRTGASVLLLDKASFPRDKTCGDGIAPHVLDVLGALGVDGIAAGFEPVRSLSLETPDGRAAGELRRPDYTIPRYVLDARIVDAAVGAGAELRRHNVREVRVEADRVVVDDTFAARSLIGADGAGSMVRRSIGHQPNKGRHLAVAMRGYVAFPGLTDQRIVTSGPRWPAYAWAFPIGDGTANVGYGEVMRGQPLSRAHLLDRMADLLPEIDLADVTRLRAHHLPLSTSQPRHGNGRVLLVGDAQSLINPFTGEGIFYAVLSGSIAGHAAAVAPANAARVYATAWRRRLGRHLRHSAAAAWLARRPTVIQAAVRAAGNDRQVFDSIVELGLGDGLLHPRTLGRIARELTVRTEQARPFVHGGGR
ncbi:geranylgeranyl reductase family protein [Asanoa ferruginea]|uniref:Geranylgeranyl reductase family protein n=1 Tax=Asanoa ferruginea TaxID=53367 RepID=A0A3D9ZII2_9ACTN|nr:geranylgeranyl reductase family protein [Asanoa ferruginea]REF97051.1 geranylgeranyl reductase family protein [Asanoa ferruginea]GIF50517.1 drug:proton antiporter [Asanoa ferruginea]